MSSHPPAPWSTTPAALLAEQLARDPTRPLVTYYDDAGTNNAAGGRVELSVATLANWVAKTANLCQDQLGIELGERVAVSLPAHWQTPAVLLGCWSVGAVVTDRLGGSRVAFVAADRVEQADDAGVDEVLALSGTPLGARVPKLPVGVLDYAVEVPGHGDRFAPYAPIHDDAAAVDIGGKTRTGAALVALGRAVDLGGDDRLLTVFGYDSVAEIVTGLIGPLAAGAGVVLCVGAGALTADTLARRAANERVTVTAGIDIPGLRRLDS